MRIKSKLGLVLLLSAITVGTAAAQGPGGGGGFRGGFGGGFGGGGIRLLQVPEVQTELKMTPDQISKIADEQQQVQDSMADLRQNSGDFQSMTPDQRQDFQNKANDIQEKAVGDILTDPAQLKRYHELELQREGPAALGQKSVQDQLNFTDAQRKQISDINDKVNADRQAAFQAVGGFQSFRSMSDDDRQKFFTKMQGINDAGNAKLLGVLTDSQKAQWKTMQGAPFTFPQGGGPGGFGGRRRGGGGGPGGGGPGGGGGGGNAAVQ